MSTYFKISISSSDPRELCDRYAWSTIDNFCVLPKCGYFLRNAPEVGFFHRFQLRLAKKKAPSPWGFFAKNQPLGIELWSYRIYWKEILQFEFFAEKFGMLGMLGMLVKLGYLYESVSITQVV